MTSDHTVKTSARPSDRTETLERRRLTDDYCRKLKAKKGVRLVVMDDGSQKGGVSALGYMVLPSNARHFFVRFRTRGTRETSKVRRVKIDAQPEKRDGRLESECAAARRVAKQHLASRSQNVDPSVTWREEKHAPNLAMVWARFIEYCTNTLKVRPGTLRAYESLWRLHIEPAFGTEKITELNHDRIAAWHKDKAEMPTSANRALAVLRRATKYYAVKATNPAVALVTEHIKMYPEEGRIVMLDEEEMARFHEALDKAEREGLWPAPKWQRYAAKHPKRIPANPVILAAIRFLFFTGMRPGEVTNLQWKQVDVSEGIVTLPSTKTKDTSQVRVLGEEAIEVLRTNPPRAGNPYVFPGRIAGKPIGNLRYLLDAVMHEAQLDHVTPHGLRHNRISWTVVKTESLELAGKLAGHESEKSTRGYAHRLRKHLKDAAAKADTVMAPRGPAKVIPITKKA